MLQRSGRARQPAGLKAHRPQMGGLPRGAPCLAACLRSPWSTSLPSPSCMLLATVGSSGTWKRDSGARDVPHEDANLAVVDLAPVATPLPFHPDRMRAPF